MHSHVPPLLRIIDGSKRNFSDEIIVNEKTCVVNSTPNPNGLIHLHSWGCTRKCTETGEYFNVFNLLSMFVNKYKKEFLAYSHFIYLNIVRFCFMYIK